MKPSFAWSKAPSFLFFLGAAAVLCGSVVEFYNMAWGTGHWLGQLSFKWAFALLIFCILCAAALQLLRMAMWPDPASVRIWEKLAGFRDRLGWGRWLLAFLVVAAPVWFLQYSPWGVAVSKPYLRLLIWAASGALVAILIQRPKLVWTWQACLAGVLLCGAGFVLAAPFGGVTSYPFSLGWSEGNRLWDYSLLFGIRAYSFPPGKPPMAYLDLGRQFLGGAPFLLPRVSIFAERAWVAVLATLPYLALALLAFSPQTPDPDRSWILAGIWGFAFLSQGPIHAPLLFCGILVALAWRRMGWLGPVLMACSGYLAAASRFTWVFAPAMWAVMLVMGSEKAVRGPLAKVARTRALLMGLAGLLGSAAGLIAGRISSGTSVATSTGTSTSQALLWYRLLPNATYGNGILLGLLLAAGPLVVLLIYLAAKYWKPSWIQLCVVVLPLAAFLGVGLVVSTKIGGGGDLHNLDMFLIGLLFTASLVWRASRPLWMAALAKPGRWVQASLLLLVVLPAVGPLMSLRPLSFSRDAGWLAVLTDMTQPKDLGSLADTKVVQASLHDLREAVDRAQTRGEVLFMDQRQLLTFGYLPGVRLLGDYEKKRMMDEALSGNAAYFRVFYEDLALHRFSLIVSSPLRTPIKDSDYGFGEENNAWVRWVAKPVLCYYEEQDTLNEVKIELLIPRTTPAECSLPIP